MEVILLLLILLLVYAVIRGRNLIRMFYMIHKAQKQMNYSHKKQAQEKVKTKKTPKSSVDVIQNAQMDLDGGEYVDYEDVK